MQEVFTLSSIVFTGIVLAFAIVIFGLIARAMIVDSREYVRFNFLQRAGRLSMDPSLKQAQKARVVQLTARGGLPQDISRLQRTA